MVKGKILTCSSNIDEALKIRKAVFQDELGFESSIDIDGLDGISEHVIVENDTGEYVATGRIYFDGTCFVISKVAVLKGHRGKSYGDFVIRMLVNKAVIANMECVKCISLKGSTMIFKKIGFFEEKSDDVFSYLTLNTSKIIKCCNCK